MSTFFPHFVCSLSLLCLIMNLSVYSVMIMNWWSLWNNDYLLPVIWNQIYITGILYIQKELQGEKCKCPWKTVIWMVIFLQNTKPCVWLLVMYVTMLLLYFTLLYSTMICIFLFRNYDWKRVVLSFFCFCFFYSLPLNLYHDKYLSWMKDDSEHSGWLSQGHGITHLMCPWLFPASVYIL